jgi:hypothetical protein
VADGVWLVEALYPRHFITDFQAFHLCTADYTKHGGHIGAFESGHSFGVLRLEEGFSYTKIRFID